MPSCNISKQSFLIDFKIHCEGSIATQLGTHPSHHYLGHVYLWCPPAASPTCTAPAPLPGREGAFPSYLPRAGTGAGGQQSDGGFQGALLWFRTFPDITPGTVN